MRVALASIALAAVLTVTPALAADDIPGWQKSIAMTIAKKQVYPRSAIDNEIEGKAKVKVTIDRTGKITTYAVVQPTGQDVLDKEVPKLMDRINPLPTPPASLSDAQLTFVLPITWALN